MTHVLLVPFLNQDPTYCYGVEFGMQIMAPMLRGKRTIKGYFRTENEEQIRLAAYRMGYRIVSIKPWKFEGNSTDWVWMVLRREKRINYL